MTEFMDRSRKERELVKEQDNRLAKIKIGEYLITEAKKIGLKNPVGETEGMGESD